MSGVLGALETEPMNRDAVEALAREGARFSDAEVRRALAIMASTATKVDRQGRIDMLRAARVMVSFCGSSQVGLHVDYNFVARPRSVGKKKKKDYGAYSVPS